MGNIVTDQEDIDKMCEELADIWKHLWPLEEENTDG